jgi:activator of HSP90 ATPase
MQRFTGAPATGEAKEGAAWSWMAGAIHGTYEVLLPGEGIVTSWRFKDWAPDTASRVTITLGRLGPDACSLKLVQTGIPETDAHGNGNVEVTVANGWKHYIFQAIKARLGFGMEEV